MDENQLLMLFKMEQKRYPTLSIEEQNVLLEKYGDEEAHQKLINHNIGLAMKIANQYQPYCKTMSFLDLIQESCLILMKAIENYDENRETKLSTFIGKSISRALQRKIDEQDDTIRVSAKMKKSKREYNKYISDYKKTTGLYPTSQEIKKATKLSDYYMEAVEKQLPLFDTDSLDRVYSSKIKNREMVLGDTIAAEDKITLIDEEIDELFLLQGLSDFLTPKDYYILYYRVISEQKKGVKEMAKEIGVTYQQVSKRKKQSLKKIAPVLQKIKSETAQKYRIKDIDRKKLIPIPPKLHLALYYLKTNTDKLTYHIIYTKLCNSENDNIFYYQRQFPEERKDNIIDILCSTATFFEEYFTDSILDKIFHSQGLTIDQAYELNIMPEESTQKR